MLNLNIFEKVEKFDVTFALNIHVKRSKISVNSYPFFVGLQKLLALCILLLVANFCYVNAGALRTGSVISLNWIFLKHVFCSSLIDKKAKSLIPLEKNLILRQNIISSLLY